MTSQTLSSKPKEEPAVVALQVVVHESTSKLILATVTLHLFGGDVELVMISWIISLEKKVIWKEVAQIHGENIMIET